MPAKSCSSTVAAGKSMQNGLIESFNGRLREEFLNEVLSTSLGEARRQIQAWRDEDNRPCQKNGSTGTRRKPH